VHIPEIIDNAGFGEIVRDREKLSSSLDSEPPKAINLSKIFKNVFNNCKNAGLYVLSHKYCYNLKT
jgi:hypothetical protein